ncbi:MAG: hypothetical protein PHU80_01145 [Kiritimatiellae bacterium]|nr:hypothetical protein [Kiritimatiellia bacterium]
MRYAVMGFGAGGRYRVLRPSVYLLLPKCGADCRVRGSAEVCRRGVRVERDAESGGLLSKRTLLVPEVLPVERKLKAGFVRPWVMLCALREVPKVKEDGGVGDDWRTVLGDWRT